MGFWSRFLDGIFYYGIYLKFSILINKKIIFITYIEK